MQIALTGATGFVGTHTAHAVMEAGHRLRVLVRDAGRLPEGLAQRADVVAGDLSDHAALARLTEGADAVIHVAGAIKASSLAAFMQANAAGAGAVAAAAARGGSRRFVHVSSLAAREPHLSGYCASKAAGEVAVREAAEVSHAMDLVIIRPPAVYGPGDRATLPLVRELSKRVALMTGTAEQRLSLIHVEDLAAALVAAAQGAGSAGACHEVDDGTPGGYSHDDMVQAAAHSTGSVARLVHLPHALLWLAGLFGEGWMKLSGRPVILSRGKARELYHRDWVCAGGRFEETGAWRPVYRFAEGYGHTLKWYRNNGWLPAG